MSQSPESAPAGVIHDIGYRGYDGPRLDRSLIARALYMHSLRGVFGLGRSARSKVIPIGLLVVMILPALIMAVVTVVSVEQGLMDGPPMEYAGYATALQAAIAIFIATQAPQAVSLDLRFNTLPLYLSRPLERVDYVVAKYAALATGVFIVLAVPILILYAGALIAELPFDTESGEMLLALLGAALFALVLSGIGLVIASVTKRRGFGVAAIITVFMMSSAVANVMQGFIGHGQGNMTAAGWLGLLSPFTLVDGVQVWALGADGSTPAEPPNDVAGVVFCLVTLGVVVGCLGLLLLRYRKVKL